MLLSILHPKKKHTHNVLRYLVARWRNHFCQGNAIIRSLFIVGVDVAVNNIKGFSVAMEMQKLVLFALLSKCLVLLFTISIKYYECVCVRACVCTVALTL